MKFTSFETLIDRINEDLGDFKSKFAYKRKELADLGKAPNRNVLFKYIDSDRDWAINEGGGTEIQYHLFYRDNTIGYGLGFNAQYVPFANEMSPVAYIKPFVSSYLNLLKQKNPIIIKLKNDGFAFIEGEEKDLNSIENDDYYLFGKEITIDSSNNISDKDYNQMIDYLKNDIYKLYVDIWEEKIKATKTNENMVNAMNLLTANHNLILTGAPGTGKTYLAKQIAQQMIFGETKEDLLEEEQKMFNEQCGFVQFHPSYDYTDFVEGLRPKQDAGNVGFERKDGVFKDFCIKALKCWNGEQQITNFNDIYSLFIDEIIESNDSLELKTLVQGKNFNVKVNGNQNLYAIPQTEKATPMPITKKMLQEYLEKGLIVDWKPYVTAIGNYFKSRYDNKFIRKESDKNAKYVFIIDEINRGEVSKIFGELFFSIDPGYRGKDGKARTQYANMQTNPNVFDNALGINDPNNCGHFFVPENVYIIGTMNDIDRSVESMDFAFRRRFAFKEMTAEESKQMLECKDAWGKDEDDNSRQPKQSVIDEINKKMDAINHIIWHKAKDGEKEEEKSIDGLSSAYHIGASYFLKLVNYKNEDGSYDYDQLWENHLEGLLLEYMRGMVDIQKKIKRLAKAFGYSNLTKYE